MRANGPRWSRLATNGNVPRARQPAVGRLEAENAAERARHADRAVGVGAERERREPAARPPRRSRRTSRPLMCVEIVRIARRPVVRVLAGEVIGVFAHVERADEHRAGAPPAARPASRRPSPAARSRLIFEPARVGRPATSNRFLTANGAPASGPSASPARARGVERRRCASARSAVTSVKAPQRAVARLDARQRRLDDLARARRAALRPPAAIARRRAVQELGVTPRTPAPARPRRRAKSRTSRDSLLGRFADALSTCARDSAVERHAEQAAAGVDQRVGVEFARSCDRSRKRPAASSSRRWRLARGSSRSPRP